LQSYDCKTGYSVKLQIRITQHSRYELLLNNLVDTLGCGTVKKHSKDTKVFIISGLKNINEKIIPLFNEYKVRGVKYLDFKDFCETTGLVNKGIHIILEGL